MSAKKPVRGLVRSERIYRKLLVLFPATFRSAHSTDALELFRDRYREEYRRAGAWGISVFWMRALWDVLVSGSMQRWYDSAEQRDRVGTPVGPMAYRRRKRWEVIIGGYVSSSMFSVLQTPPLLGRTLVPEDDGADPEPVFVLGYGLWQRRFGGDPNVIGQTLEVGLDLETGIAGVIVGVMPEGFAFPHKDTALWTQLPLDPARTWRGGGFRVVDSLRQRDQPSPGARGKPAPGDCCTNGAGSRLSSHIRCIPKPSPVFCSMSVPPIRQPTPWYRWSWFRLVFWQAMSRLAGPAVSIL